MIPTGRSVSYRYRNAWCLIPHRKQGTRDLLSTSSKHQKCKHHINIVNDTGTDTTNNQRSGISQYIIGLSHGKHRRRKTSYKIDLSKKAIDNHFQAHSKSRLSFLPAMSVLYRCTLSQSSKSIWNSSITAVQKGVLSLLNDNAFFYSNVWHRSVTPSCVPISVNSPCPFQESSLPLLQGNSGLLETNCIEGPFDLSTWLISTLKRRKKKMNKHKLRKRRKLLRLKAKK